MGSVWPHRRRNRNATAHHDFQRHAMLLPHTLNYSFLAPARIVFGWGTREQIGDVARRLGKRAFVVNGSRRLAETGLLDELTASLTAAGVSAVPLTTVVREPTVEDIDNAVDKLRAQEPQAGDFVIGVGGGSAIDLAKAVAALATNHQGDSVVDFLEGVGRGLTIDTPPLPMLAMPTTAGTGAEATKNAVVSSFDPAFKKSLRADAMVPDAVIVDPELTVSLPPDVTAHTGMDALTQLIESYISRRAQPIPQALCRQGIALAFPALLEAVEDGTSQRARECMSHAALLSGLALANSGLGMAHGVAAALGVRHNISHGLACAVMLPVALRANASVCPAEMLELAHVFGHHDERDARAAAEHVIDAVERLARRIGIPERLGDLGVTADDLPGLVTDSRGNSMNGNPRKLSDEQLHRILEERL